LLSNLGEGYFCCSRYYSKWWRNWRNLWLFRRELYSFEGICFKNLKRLTATVYLPYLFKEKEISILFEPCEVPFENSMVAIDIDTALAELNPLKSIERLEAQEILSWSKKRSLKTLTLVELSYLSAKIENFLFGKIIQLSKCTPGEFPSALEIERLVELYSDIRGIRMKNANFEKHVMDSRFHSYYLIVCWIAVCIIHHHAIQEFPILKNYSMPLDPGNLQYILSEDFYVVSEVIPCLFKVIPCLFKYIKSWMPCQGRLQSFL
jgi:hypothetical protein